MDHLLGGPTSLITAPYTGMPADIIVLDENMNFSGFQCRGTSLGRALRERGFVGVICLLSGESLTSHNSQVLDPVFDAVLTKGSESLSGLAHRLRALHKQKRSQKHVHSSATTPQQDKKHV